MLKQVQHDKMEEMLKQVQYDKKNQRNVCHAEFISASEYTLKYKYPYMANRSYHNYWVYILTNKPNGTLYIGVTGGIDDRMERHVKGEGSKFTAKYKLKMLVYFEEFQYIDDAIAREKQLKNWHRQWKINLIEAHNPNWENLWKGD